MNKTKGNKRCALSEKELQRRKTRTVTVPLALVYGDVSLQAKGLYQLLRDHCGDGKDFCWQSVDTLAEEAKCSSNRIRVIAKELETAGFIRIERRPDPQNPKCHLTNHYTLLDPRLADPNLAPYVRSAKIDPETKNTPDPVELPQQPFFDPEVEAMLREYGPKS